MASGISVITKALDIKGMHIDRVEYVDDEAVMCGERYRHDHIDIVESCVDDPNKARNNFGSTFLKSNPNLTHQKLKILS